MALGEGPSQDGCSSRGVGCGTASRGLVRGIKFADERPGDLAGQPVSGVSAGAASPPGRDADAGVEAALAEIHRVLDAPLAGLMESDEDRAHAGQLTRDVLAVPVMVTLGKLVACVGDRRPATQAGNLTAPDAVAVARLLRAGADVPDVVSSMDDLPDVAHVVRWAIASELLTVGATKIVAVPRARDLEHDPLSAWFTAAVTLLEHGPLDGFQRGWHKLEASYLSTWEPGDRVSDAAVIWSPRVRRETRETR